MPKELGYLWEFYRELFNGQNLTYSEINHWAQLTGTNLLCWEVQVLVSLDRAFWRVQSEQ